MPETTARLSTALADRYSIERRLGEGGHMVEVIETLSARGGSGPREL